MTAKPNGWFRDALAGSAATAVILPQAMAFGVLLLAPLGIDSGAAALAGLLGGRSAQLRVVHWGRDPAVLSVPLLDPP